MPKVTVQAMQCCRCDHTWIPRANNPDPKVCPACKSPYWNTPKRATSGKSKGR